MDIGRNAFSDQWQALLRRELKALLDSWKWYLDDAARDEAARENYANEARIRTRIDVVNRALAGDAQTAAERKELGTHGRAAEGDDPSRWFRWAGGRAGALSRARMPGGCTASRKLGTTEAVRRSGQQANDSGTAAARLQIEILAQRRLDVFVGDQGVEIIPLQR